jgi:hypothetical protein
MDSIRLQDAYLCECGMIGANANRCVCGNQHGLLCLSTVLNRSESCPVPLMPRNAPVDTSLQKRYGI